MTQSDIEADQAFLRPGRNCWRIERAHRFRLLVDGAEYFAALRCAILACEHTLFIVGWDIDSRMRLCPAGSNDGFPEPLEEFLKAVLKARPHLRIYVLTWDFAMLYAFEREWLPVLRHGFEPSRRFAFRQDGKHPIGASHHQKIVLLDDVLAFVGGLDLTRSRWDTCEHASDAPLRCDTNGTRYGPFHDVHAMFDGAAARAMGDLVRERWRRACGRRAASRSRRREAPRDPWPRDCVADVTEVDLALARTEPAFAGRSGVYEIRQLYLDAIGLARRHIYIENQYFTSAVIGAAIEASLHAEHGPEIVVVSRRSEDGWLQAATMGVLRARLHRILSAADHARRYRMLAPCVPGLGERCLNVHSKLLIADDRLLTVGSANLNNRSMGLDTECNVTLYAGSDARVAEAIAAMRNRLVAEHAGVEPGELAARLVACGSLIATIDALHAEHPEARHLAPLEPRVAPQLDALVPESAIIDPEQPVAADELIARIVPPEHGRTLIVRMLAFGATALLVALAISLWYFTPLRHYLNLPDLMRLAQRLRQLPGTGLLVIGGYVLAGFLSVPITLLLAATGLVFGALQGSLYAFAGTLFSAAATYLAGRWLGRDIVRRLAGKRINRLSERLAARGLVAMVILRLLPVAPFTVINVVAGASQIGLRDYMLGTLLGMGPGIIVTVAFAHQLANVLRHPSLTAFAFLVLVGVLLVSLSISLQRILRRRGVGASANRGLTARQGST